MVRLAVRCAAVNQGRALGSMTSICQTREHDAGDACAPGCDQHSDSRLCAGLGIRITDIKRELEEEKRMALVLVAVGALELLNVTNAN